MMPKESMLVLVDASKKLMIKDALKAGGFVLSLTSLFYAYPYLHTSLERILIVSIQIISGVGAFLYLRYILNTVKSLKRLTQYYTQLHAQMSKMSEDIKKLGGPSGLGF